MMNEDEQEKVSFKLRKLRLHLNQQRRRIENITCQAPSSQFDAPRGLSSDIPEISPAQLVTEIERLREQMITQTETHQEVMQTLQNEVTDIKKTCHNRHGAQREDQHPHQESRATVDVNSSEVKQALAIGKYVTKCTHNHYYAWDPITGSWRQIPEPSTESSLQSSSSGARQVEQLSAEPTNVVPTGAEFENESFSDDFQLKDNLKVEDTEKGRNVIIKIPSKTKLELHVFTEEDMSDETDIYFMKNERIWQVTINNIQKCVWIAVKRPGHSGEVYSFLRGLVAQYPSSVPKAHCASGKTDEAFHPNPSFVERVNLGDIPTPFLRMDTQSNISYILLIACTDKDDLVKVSELLDKKMKEPKHGNRH